MKQTVKAAKHAFLCLAAVALICAGPVRSSAQVSTASLEGLVTDTTGATVPNATVVVKNMATGIERNATTNADGLYAAPDLQPGAYRLSVTAQGFAVQKVNDLVLSVGAKQIVNFTLKVGSASEQIEVVDSAVTVDLASSTVKPVVDSKTVQDLPLNGRDWAQLANLEPGVAAVRTQSAVSVSNQRANRGVGNQITISGSRPQGNNYRVDGISINDYSNGAPGGVIGANLGVDAIQEFSVISSNASGDVGKTSGGVINAVTRSGTNTWHGSAYEFLRNSALDARNEFDLPKRIAPFRRNQFGASIGGPIQKDRTFIFGDYEGLRQFQSTNVSSTVPSPNARNGQLVSGAVAVSPKVAPYLALYPVPNSTINGDTGIFLFNDPTTTHENYFTIRGDHQFRSADSFNATYFYDRGDLSAPDPFDVRVAANLDRRQGIALGESHIFSPTFLNKVRIGFSRNVSIAPTTVSAINPAAKDTTLGFVPGLPVGLINIGAISNFQGGLGAVGEFDFHFNSYQAYDDVYLSHGKHAFQFGFSFERLQNNQIGRANPNGQFVFADLKSFLTDTPTSASAISFNAPTSTGVTDRDLRQSVFGVYFVDDYRVKQNLTLNLSVRYEPASVPTETANRIANLPTLTSPTPRLGSPYFNNPTRRNFAPRIGLSWDPFKKGTTAIRAAYGIYDVLPLNYLFEGLSIFGAPFFQQGNVTNLPAGVFPTGAFPLLTANKLRYSFNDSNPARSYVQQWGVNIQQQVPGDLVLQVGYSGAHGVHLPYRVDDVNTVQPVSTTGGYFFPTPAGSGTLLNPNIGQLSALFWTGFSKYHALQMRANKRMTHHFQTTVSYTWAKSIDDGSSSTFGDSFSNSVSSLPFWAPNRRIGLSDFDIRHNLVINALYELPRFQGLTGKILGGWQLGGIFQVSTGLPLTPLISGDPLGLRSADVFAFPDRLSTAGCTGNPVNTQNRFHYIKTQCFAFPKDAAGVNQGTRLGTSARNSVTGPGLQDLDFSLIKNTSITERLNLQFRTEFFNILNHVNYANPPKASTQLFSASGAALASAGALTQTATSARQLQFALKLMF